jgi:putative transposase
MITSNHIHLLVADDGGRDVIPSSMQLVAGRTGQEYNQRKSRKGAYWEDRYHATAVESGDHLARCMAYIDLNMVRAGVVSHPASWPFCGYNEIQKPRRKNVIIDYEKLQGLFGTGSYENLRGIHKGWIEEYLLKEESQKRQAEWTESIAVGGKTFIEKAKGLLGIRAMGRDVIEGGGGYQLREEDVPYKALLWPKKDDIDPENTYFLDINYE